MKYDPSHVYSGPAQAPLATLEDSFHFAVRCVLRSRQHLAGYALRTDQFAKNGNETLESEGWAVIDGPSIEQPKVLVRADDQGRGLVVSPICYSDEKHFDYIVKNLPAALAGI